MASATSTVRLSVRYARRATFLRPRPGVAALRVQNAFLSTTRPRFASTDIETAGAPDGKPLAGVGDSNAENTEQATEAEYRAAWGRLPEDERMKLDRMLNEVKFDIGKFSRPVKAKRNGFWNEEEDDSDLITSEVGEDDFEEDDILSMGHAKLEEHREYREYARLAVWELPLLAQFAKPFEPPAADEPLRFRYTTFMGELHPAERKVVVEFCPKDLGLTEAQQLKLLKLSGPRYNPTKDIIRMSCNMHDHQAQNKRYLGDLIQKMIAEAKDTTDMFEDIPLDTRHHYTVTKPKFPAEWRLTEERKNELEAQRRQALLLDEAKRAEAKLIDGVQTIRMALADGSDSQAKVAEMATIKAPSNSRSTMFGRK